MACVSRALQLALLALALATSAGSALAQERREPPGERDRIEMPESLQSELRGLPPVERRRMEGRLRRMPDLRRNELFRRWEGLSPDERARAVARARGREQRRQAAAVAMRQRLSELPPAERRAFFERARRWRAMDAGQRAQMRGRLGRFGALSPAQQEELVARRFAGKSDAERAQILSQLRAAADVLPPAPGAAPPGPRPPAN
jgi:hypothetical protein